MHSLPYPLAFVDLETTRDRIIEIGVLRIDRTGPPRVLDTLVNPGVLTPRSFDYWNTHIHGLQAEDLVDAPTFAEVLPQLVAILDGTAVVAHNASCERRHLTLEYARCGLAFDQPMIDTLPLSRRRWPDLDNHRLTTLTRRLGIPHRPAHRALADATATMGLLVRVFQAAGAQENAA